MKTWRRALSLLLLAAMLLSFGGQALAEGEAAVLTAVVYAKKSGRQVCYTSPNQLGRVSIRSLRAERAGEALTAFCLDGGKDLKAGEALERQEVFSAPAGVTRFLDYFYYKSEEHQRLHREHPEIACASGDRALKKLYPALWDPDALLLAAASVQSAVWLWEKGRYEDGGDAWSALLAAERDAISASWSGKKDGKKWVEEALAATDPQTGWTSERTYWVYRQGTERVILPAAADRLELPVIGAAGYALAELPLYDAADTAASRRTLPAGAAFAVREETGRRWRVAGEFGEGWVDHTYCMVNLPDVLPSVVYKITNGYRSLFRSQGAALSGVTGQALYTGKTGNLRLDREEFLAPVLYAMAKKLAAAQSAALAEGDTLVLYEAYRPLAAQERVRDAFHKLLESNPQVRAAVNTGGWNEGWFIAQDLSNHQRGCAVDVSLAKITKSKSVSLGEYAYTRVEAYEEYQMPSAMHELSPRAAAFGLPLAVADSEGWRSYPLAPGFTEPAKRLQDYCTGVGLTPLASEWWHFNDLSACQRTGQAGEGRFEITQCPSQPLDASE